MFRVFLLCCGFSFFCISGQPVGAQLQNGAETGTCPEIENLCDRPIPMMKQDDYQTCDSDLNCAPTQRCCKDPCFAHTICKEAAFDRDRRPEEPAKPKQTDVDDETRTKSQLETQISADKMQQTSEEMRKPDSEEQSENLSQPETTDDVSSDYADFYFPGLLHLETTTLAPEEENIVEKAPERGGRESRELHKGSDESEMLESVEISKESNWLDSGEIEFLSEEKSAEQSAKVFPVNFQFSGHGKIKFVDGVPDDLKDLYGSVDGSGEGSAEGSGDEFASGTRPDEEKHKKTCVEGSDDEDLDCEGSGDSFDMKIWLAEIEKEYEKLFGTKHPEASTEGTVKKQQCMEGSDDEDLTCSGSGDHSGDQPLESGSGSGEIPSLDFDSEDNSGGNTHFVTTENYAFATQNPLDKINSQDHEHHHEKHHNKMEETTEIPHKGEENPHHDFNHLNNRAKGTEEANTLTSDEEHDLNELLKREDLSMEDFKNIFNIMEEDEEHINHAEDSEEMNTVSSDEENDSDEAISHEFLSIEDLENLLSHKHVNDDNLRDNDNSHDSSETKLFSEKKVRRSSKLDHKKPISKHHSKISLGNPLHKRSLHHKKPLHKRDISHQNHHLHAETKPAVPSSASLQEVFGYHHSSDDQSQDNVINETPEENLPISSHHKKHPSKKHRKISHLKKRSLTQHEQNESEQNTPTNSHDSNSEDNLDPRAIGETHIGWITKRDIKTKLDYKKRIGKHHPKKLGRIYKNIYRNKPEMKSENDITKHTNHHTKGTSFEEAIRTNEIPMRFKRSAKTKLDYKKRIPEHHPKKFGTIHTHRGRHKLNAQNQIEKAHHDIPKPPNHSTKEDILEEALRTNRMFKRNAKTKLDYKKRIPEHHPKKLGTIHTHLGRHELNAQNQVENAHHDMPKHPNHSTKEDIFEEAIRTNRVFKRNAKTKLDYKKRIPEHHPKKIGTIHTHRGRHELNAQNQVEKAPHNMAKHPNHSTKEDILEEAIRTNRVFKRSVKSKLDNKKRIHEYHPKKIGRIHKKTHHNKHEMKSHNEVVEPQQPFEKHPDYHALKKGIEVNEVSNRIERNAKTKLDYKQRIHEHHPKKIGRIGKKTHPNKEGIKSPNEVVETQQPLKENLDYNTNKIKNQNKREAKSKHDHKKRSDEHHLQKRRTYGKIYRGKRGTNKIEEEQQNLPVPIRNDLNLTASNEENHSEIPDVELPEQKLIIDETVAEILHENCTESDFVFLGEDEVIN